MSGRSPSFLPPFPQRGNAKRPGNRQSGRPFPPVPPFFVRGETERRRGGSALGVGGAGSRQLGGTGGTGGNAHRGTPANLGCGPFPPFRSRPWERGCASIDRKSTRLHSSH